MQATIEQTKPLLMQRDGDQIKAALRVARPIEESLTQVLKAWKALSLAPLTQQEINTIVHDRNAEPLVRARIAGEVPLKVQGVKLDLEAIRKMVAIPDLSELQQAIANANNALKVRSPFSWSVDHFTLEGDKVQLSTESEQHLLDAYSLYANSEEEQEVFNEITEISNALNALVDKYPALATSYPVLQRIPTGYTVNPYAVTFAAASKVNV